MRRLLVALGRLTLGPVCEACGRAGGQPILHLPWATADAELLAVPLRACGRCLDRVAPVLGLAHQRRPVPLQVPCGACTKGLRLVGRTLEGRRYGFSLCGAGRRAWGRSRAAPCGLAAPVEDTPDARAA